jgi:hypothetical protein
VFLSFAIENISTISGLPHSNYTEFSLFIGDAIESIASVRTNLDYMISKGLLIPRSKIE